MKNRALSFTEFVNEAEKPEALNRGMRTLTDAQYAVIYLLYKGKTSALPQPYRSMEEKDLRIHAGLSDQTLRHRKREMAILDGQEDLAVKGDEYYEELRHKLQDMSDIDSADLQRTARLFLAFQEMTPQDVAAVAHEAFTDENKEVGEYYHNKNIEQQSKYAQDKKVKENDVRKKAIQEVSDYTKGFTKNGTSFADARKKAIDMVAKKLGKPVPDIMKWVNGK